MMNSQSNKIRLLTGSPSSRAVPVELMYIYAGSLLSIQSRYINWATMSSVTAGTNYQIKKRQSHEVMIFHILKITDIIACCTKTMC